MLGVVLILFVGHALAVPIDQLPDFDEAYPEENPGLFEGDIILMPGQNPNDRNARRDKNYRWPNGEVPFEIDTHHFSSSEESTIHTAMQTIHEKTKVNGKACITFKPRTHEHAYIRYAGGSGCHTPVGRHSGLDVVTLGSGCMKLGTVMHETMHSLGFWHEQSRPDRDNYITIEWSNIRKGHEKNFDRRSSVEADTFGRPYDYESVMHYNAYEFAIDRSKPTIIVKKKGVSIGQRDHLSHGDIQEMQIYYGCSTHSGKRNSNPSTSSETCNFQTDLCKWQNGGDINWIRTRGSTSTSHTGPTTDHSGSSSGYYAYLEASGNEHKKGYLLSETFAAGNYCLSVYYSMHGHDEGSLKLGMQTGGHDTNLHTVSGDQGHGWHHYMTNLEVKTGDFKVKIEGDIGSAHRSDIAIDDLTVTKGDCSSL
ncbi:hatching enzyme 1.2-like [Haliotis cracherodii]|uniref:hatching enzyme 1.2-like n=1 Tax=Haliotis cracherodii TaxID=6455 RepID=UPI0039E9D2A2